MQLALIARFYERIGDHAVNIGEWVQYAATGELPNPLPEVQGSLRHRRRPRRGLIVTAAVAALVAAAAAAMAVVVTRADGRRAACAALARRLDPGQPDAAVQRLDASLQAIERVAAEAAKPMPRRKRCACTSCRSPSTRCRSGSSSSTTTSGVLLRNAPAEHFLGVRYADAFVEEAVRTNLRTRALAGEPSTQTLDLHGPPRRIVVVRALPVQETDAGVGHRAHRGRERAVAPRGHANRLRRRTSATSCARPSARWSCWPRPSRTRTSRR